MNDFDLRHFVETYINFALEASNQGLSLDDFYKHIYRTVSERTGLSEEAIKYLHHPFHWVLFSWSNPPLEFIESSKLNGSSRVQIKNSVDASVLVSRVLEKYGALLEERLKTAKTFAQ